MVKIGHASSNENGKVSGGLPGDQTRKEICMRNWYNKPWGAVIRAKDSALADRMAMACETICVNDFVGYSQDRRNSLHTEAKRVGYDLKKIKTPCDADCSSFVTICAIAAGVKELEYSGNAPTTRTLVRDFLKTGKFIALEEPQYTHSDQYLRRGDILVKAGSHTVMVLTNGAAQYTMPNLQNGSKGEYVKKLQEVLNSHGYDLVVDGAFGPKTRDAVKDYQSKHSLVIDGIVGKMTWKSLGVL